MTDTISVGGLSTLHNTTANVNFNAPTNPKFHTFTTNLSGTRVFGVVCEDGADATTISEPIGSAGLMTEYSNLGITDGFSIKCYDAETTTGLNLATIDLADDFFVLLHSDDANLHHLAKITNITGADTDGDKFEFEPALGNQINKGVKFMVFKSNITTNTNIVAITAGLKGSDDYEVVCANPLWYFYNDKLDKNNELNHNTKYLVKMDDASSGSTISLNNPDAKKVFSTVDSYRNKVIDYSKFSYHITTKDNLKARDDPDSNTSNEGFTLTVASGDDGDYDQIMINARRSATDSYADVDDLGAQTGQTRYLHYTLSPSKANLLPTVISSFIEESAYGKAGYSETKLIDTSKIYGKKITLNDKYVVRQSLGRDSFSDWKEIAEIKAFVSSNRYSLDTTNSGLPEDIGAYVNSNDEIKIGNRLVKISAIISTDTLTLDDNSRLETESIYTNTFDIDTLVAGTKVYRRAFNIQDNSLLTDIEFDNSRHNKMKLILHSKAFKSLEVSLVVSPTDAKYKLLYLTFDGNIRGYGYNSPATTNGLQYCIGDYTLLYEVFTGKIEKINRTIEHNVPYMTIQGRNTFSKLLDPITNKDTRYSEDIIYSSQSPYNTLTAFTSSVTGTILFTSKNIVLSGGQTVVAGEKLWTNWGFIGEVASSSTHGGTGITTIVLVNFPKVKGVAGTSMFREASQELIFNKALASNPYIASTTDLNGASDKGLYFKGGNTLTGHFNALVEGDSLVGLSQDSNSAAVGFNINSINNVLSDSVFQAVLQASTRNITNTLMDFTVLSVKKDSSNSIVKLAPYIPVTLGRSHINYSNINDESTFTNLGRSKTQSSSVAMDLIIDDDGAGGAPTNAQKAAIYAISFGDPLYVDDTGTKTFIGRFLSKSCSGTVFTIYLDRSIDSNIWANNKDIYTLTDKTQHDLHFINGAHLHGGKIVGLLGPDNTLFDYELYNNAHQKSYAETFGSSFFRLISLEKGNIGTGQDSHKTLRTGADFSNENNDVLYDSIPVSKYYATAYKSRKTSSGNHYTVNKTGTSPNSFWPIEQRGIIPITGSNYYDRKLFPSGSYMPAISQFYPITYTPEIGEQHNQSELPTVSSKGSFYQISPNAARLFLFVNSDNYIYSSSRRDSLLNTTLDSTITDYNLITMGDPIISDSSQSKESVIGGTSRVTHLDTSYKNNHIIECNKTLSSLTRFGLMRLTECVYDVMWNPINPEEKQDLEKTLLGDYYNYGFTLTTQAGVISSWSGDVATFNNTPSCEAGDLLVKVDSMQVIGKVSLVDSLEVTIVNTVKTVLTSNTPAYPTGTISYIKASEIVQRAFTTGVGEESTYLFTGENISLSKSLVFDGIIGGFSADTTLDWNDNYGELISNTNAADILLPIAFKYAATSYTNNPIIQEISQTCITASSTTLTVADNRVFQLGDYIKLNSTLGLSGTAGALNFITAITTANTTEVTLNAVATKSYSTGGGATAVFVSKRPAKTHNMNSMFKWWDNSGKLSSTGYSGSPTDLTAIRTTILQPRTINAGSNFVTEGTTTDLVSLLWGHVSDSASIYNYPMMASLDTYGRFKGTKRNTSAMNLKSVDGAVLGFKPCFYGSDAGSGDIIDSDPANVTGPRNKTYSHYKILHESKYKFLEFIDLTGCYLVPIKGIKEGVDVPAGFTDSSNGVTVENIIYVISHEYDTKTTLTNVNTDNSRLILDGSFVDNVQYYIMQPNPVCFWPDSPASININQLNSKYTKKANSTKMYDSMNDWDISSGNSSTRYSSLEGIASMYVVVDVDNISTVNKTVSKTTLTARAAVITPNPDGIAYGALNFAKELCLSDGETTILTKTSAEYPSGGAEFQLNFTKINKQLNGVVSVSEPFELKVNGEVNADDKRALIGAGAVIVKESEELIKELLNEIDADYSITGTEYPIYNSPDFQGTSVFNMITYLLNLKDKELIDDAGTFTVESQENKLSRFSFNDNDIIEYQQIQSSFDFYNEIIVYGSAFKSVRKNIKSIQSVGRKTLEVFANELITRDDVDKKASSLLNIHSETSQNLQLKLPVSKVKTISAGDIISCEIKQENIPRNNYIVLEITHDMGGTVELKIGKYVSNLEDRFAELLVGGAKTNSYLRKTNFVENENAFDFFDDLKIKEISLTIRKRTMGGTVLGDEGVLNTNTTTLGFGGSVTHTVLLEEDFI
jgi:hypothetical protein